MLTVARQEAARCSLLYENEPIAVAGFLMIPDVISVDYKMLQKVIYTINLPADVMSDVSILN